MFIQYAFRAALGALLMAGVAGSAYSTTITYTAVDLADTTVGQDLWQYRYKVSGSFVQFGGFYVIFGFGPYTLLEDPAPAVNADWSIVTMQPNPGLTTDGLYSATALTGSPSLADEFVLNFVWLGAGAPGSQPFEVFDDSFSVTETGQSSVAAPIGAPIPGTLFLFGVGLVLLGVVRPRIALA